VAACRCTGHKAAGEAVIGMVALRERQVLQEV
jgi:hypothetical protein